ncbi:amino acid ABC transporter permease [Roseomonas sp. BN140053]|uniref:amino acid ABC transporter permease n=1 Tax=Roseomonas sp. BN140053 TaxID=3391898 RepID=UPI0039EC70E0
MSFTETFLNAEVFLRVLPLLLTGLAMTVQLAVVAILLGVPMGLTVAMLRLYGPRPVRWLAVGYVDLFRALPMLVLLILSYYALPFVGIRLSSFAAAAGSLCVVMSAFSAEVFRAGIESVPQGQVEAARALGLHFRATMRHVVLPQAMRVVIPPLTSNCVGIFKETSLASVVALPELVKQGNDAQALTANPTPLIGVAAIYLVVLWPLVRLVARLEARNARARAR